MSPVRACRSQGRLNMRTTEEIKEQYGMRSPEYAARVYEDMLDNHYDRIARIEEQIAAISLHLDREKSEIMRQRRARRKRAEWAQIDADKAKREAAKAAESAS